ncbi:MAG: hypothetical protein AAF984_00940 [Verrucomicrobiota bacterium]
MNAFKILEVTPSPIVDFEELKTSFHRLSEKLRSNHTDGDVAELNQAYELLQNRPNRLKALLAINGVSENQLTGAKKVPEPMADLCMLIGGIWHDVDLFLKDAENYTNLERALAATKALDLLDKLQDLQQKLMIKSTEMHKQLETLNVKWKEVDAVLLNELKNFYLEDVYLSKWMEQLDERMFRLSQMV